MGQCSRRYYWISADLVAYSCSVENVHCQEPVRNRLLQNFQKQNVRPVRTIHKFAVYVVNNFKFRVGNFWSDLPCDLPYVVSPAVSSQHARVDQSV